VIAEICWLDLTEQARLVPVFQTGEFRRFFDKQTTKIDVRVITTTEPNLLHAIDCGKFLQEFYSSINAVTIDVPLLRERKEDIPALIDHYLPLAAAGLGRRRKKLASEVFDFFLSYQWPGNVSELQAVLEVSLRQSSGDTVRMLDLPSEMTARWTTFPPEAAKRVKSRLSKSTSSRQCVEIDCQRDTYSYEDNCKQFRYSGV
jgi:Nif-specific regulatory protein